MIPRHVLTRYGSRPDRNYFPLRTQGSLDGGPGWTALLLVWVCFLLSFLSAFWGS